MNLHYSRNHIPLCKNLLHAASKTSVDDVRSHMLKTLHIEFKGWFFIQTIKPTYNQLFPDLSFGQQFAEYILDFLKVFKQIDLRKLSVNLL